MTSGWFILILLVLVARTSVGQLVDEPRFDFERLSWNTSIDSLNAVLEIRWNDPRRMFKQPGARTRLTDVFGRSGSCTFLGRTVLIVAEFNIADSGLASMSFISSSGLRFSEEHAPSYEAPGTFLDSLMDVYVDRFGDEPDEDKWVPLVGGAKVWMTPKTRLRVMRMYLPSGIAMVSYIRRE